jgi:hypothetical protein
MTACFRMDALKGEGKVVIPSQLGVAGIPHLETHAPVGTGLVRWGIRLDIFRGLRGLTLM